jgi:imidazolonepropionase-like amidohydrolase
MRTLIRNVRVFDGERTRPQGDVLIDGDRIADPDNLAAEVEIDGSGRTLLPGLIDAHTHTFEGTLQRALAYGVTTELDMFCLPGELARYRRLASDRDDVADLRSAGTLATAPHGHPSQLFEAIDGGAAPASFDTLSHPGQATAFVDRRLAEGADYLKIVIDDGCLLGTHLPTLDAATVTALVTAAHAAGLRAIAHTMTVNAARIALNAGVDGLAHVYVDADPKTSVGDDLAAQLADRGAFVITTLAYIEARAAADGAGLPATFSDPAIRQNADHAIRTLLSAGVPLLAGTDATPYSPTHGDAMHRELQLLTKAGLSAAQALAAATSVPADQFGLTDRGRIHPGLRADLLLVDGDPTQDIEATRSIVHVWRRGSLQPQTADPLRTQR